MKKLISLLLAVALLLSLTTACAEPYTFSNGIRWGMTQDEVTEIMGGDNFLRLDGTNAVQLVPQNDHFSFMVCYTNISKYYGNAFYLFADNRLIMICYDGLSENGDAVHSYLSGALSKVYGEPAPLDGSDPVLFFIHLLGIDGFTLYNGLSWHAENGPLVWLNMYNDGQINLMFLDDSFELSQADIYDVTNLF